MGQARVDIISIGTLSRNRLWNEAQPVRTPHATTTLVRTDKRTILIDPGLPAPALAARLFERAGLRAEQIDTVFLTNFRPAHRAGLALFAHATTLIFEAEQQATRQHLSRLIDAAPEADLDRKVLQQELSLLDSLKLADDKLAPQVDLFPLAGYTAGTCGVLVSATASTLVIAGDAVPTREHFLAGQVLPDSFDVKAAQDALAEVYEIADVIVPGHDNLFLNPRSQGM